MGLDRARELRLADLADGLPGITPVVGAYLAEAGVVRFEEQNHSTGVELNVDGHFETIYRVYWENNVTDQMSRAWRDSEETTEHAACGIALLLICDLTGYTVIGRSRKKNGFDYWIGTEEENEDEPPSLENKIRLEVSGICKGTSGDIKARINEKSRRLGRFPNPLPAYIIVVEFSMPLSRVVIEK